mmetsp:Transcript_83135/g.144454  ORF Transcript_83135/g.144454 Transcript_83135/m.144454 type:complete len:499 (+) Transcript_83135:112-1608(+)
MLCLSHGAMMVPALLVFMMSTMSDVLQAAAAKSTRGIMVQRHDADNDEDAVQHVHTNLLRQRLNALQDSQGHDKSVGRLKFYLNLAKKKGKQNAQLVQQSRVKADPAPSDNIPQTYFQHVDDVLATAGASTPQPTNPNAPPPPPTPLPYNEVLKNNFQPLDTRAGAALLSSIQQQPTPTPPPTQEVTEEQFIAQCPMIMFENNISVRGGSCGAQMGSWVNPGSTETSTDDRVILRWYGKKSAGGLYFGVDSAISGEGSVLFADAKNVIAFRGYYFDLLNCLGIERYRIEEEVIKVDQVGQVAAMVANPMSSDSAGFYYRFSIVAGNGSTMARTNLFRLYADQVNFTEMADGQETGKLIGVAKRQGDWTGGGWHECMAASSPRGWNINFPGEKPEGSAVATVQDIRVAIAAAITIMGYREELTNPKTGLDPTNDWKQFWGMGASFGAALLVVLLICNCCFVFYWSGIHEKLQTIAFDLEAAFLPKRSMKTRLPPVHATY